MDMYSRISEVSINQIMVFLKCVELENYSKAAEALNYTPSMVSKTVKKLEEKLGLVLFIRRGAHVKPTNAAYQLHMKGAAGNIIVLIEGKNLRFIGIAVIIRAVQNGFGIPNKRRSPKGVLGVAFPPAQGFVLGS